MVHSCVMSEEPYFRVNMVRYIVNLEEKDNGPLTEHCGTPDRIAFVYERVLSSTTVCVLFESQFRVHVFVRLWMS